MNFDPERIGLALSIPIELNRAKRLTQAACSIDPAISLVILRIDARGACI